MLKRNLIIIQTLIQHHMYSPAQRFRLSLLGLFFLVITATIGYMILESMTFTDALYMTVITVTTVGFR